MNSSKVAAKWWCETISSGHLGNFNNGDPGESGGMAMTLASMLALSSMPSATKLENELAKKSNLHVSTDYHPDYFLSCLAAAYGISPDVFPWKTWMNISKDEVTVSCGYGAPAKTIFPIV